MTEILHIEVFIGRTHRHTHTYRQTDRVKTIPRNALRGEVINMLTAIMNQYELIYLFDLSPKSELHLKLLYWHYHHNKIIMLCKTSKLYLMNLFVRDSTHSSCNTLPNKAIRDGKYLAHHMPVLGNVHPIKIENVDIVFETSFLCSLELLYY